MKENLEQKECNCCHLLKLRNRFKHQRAKCNDCINLQAKEKKNKYKEYCESHPSEQKTCNKCNQIKFIGDFYCKNNKCKKCWNRVHWQNIKQDEKRFINKKKTCKKYRDNYRKNDPQRRMLEQARDRAKKENLLFNLEKSDIIIPEFCPVLGIRLERSKSGHPSDNSPSLDKIIPKLGYTKGNVAVISYKANRLKSNGNINDLERILEYMKKHIHKSDGDKDL